MGEDRRTKKTLTAIRNAMIKCLQTTPVEKVTVKQICEVADINRSTFYVYYQDQMALYQQLEGEFLEKLDTIMFDLKANVTSDEEHIHNIVHCYSMNAMLYMTMLKSRSKAFRDAQLRFVRKYHFLDGLFNETERQYALEYYMNAINGVVSSWIEGGKKQSEDYIASFLIRLTKADL
ncbi:MAG: TetR/AcrR family transcriptional regulator [Spirochaetales bacterium]|nr:TetR/AcrR family transcriptional regulator [Spirochaetales bacterium]